MSRYPILVERWDEQHPSDMAVCERCHKTVTIDPSEGDPYDRCLKHRGCGGQVVMKYEQADKCGGCGRLGFYEKALSHCCSRRCMLQAEYAKTLRS